jgi:hypothetical protein
MLASYTAPAAASNQLQLARGCFAANEAEVLNGLLLLLHHIPAAAAAVVVCACSGAA